MIAGQFDPWAQIEGRYIVPSSMTECLCPTQNSYVQIITFKVMILEGGVFIGICAFIKNPQRARVPLWPCEVTVRRRPSMRKWVLTRH